MKLSAYTKRLSIAERAEFAFGCGTTLAHLNNVSYGLRTASAALAKQIALKTEREVPEWDLRPKDWHLIWPELVGSEGAPPVPNTINTEVRDAA